MCTNTHMLNRLSIKVPSYWTRPGDFPNPRIRTHVSYIFHGYGSWVHPARGAAPDFPRTRPSPPCAAGMLHPPGSIRR